MSDQPVAGDPEPDDDRRPFDLPADQAADERFLRRQRRRRLSEFTGQDHEPDPSEDFLDAEEDAVASNDLPAGPVGDDAGASDAQEAFSIDAEAPFSSSEPFSDSPTPDTPTPDSPTRDSLTPDAAGGGSLSLSAPDVADGPVEPDSQQPAGDEAVGAPLAFGPTEAPALIRPDPGATFDPSKYVDPTLAGVTSENNSMARGPTFSTSPDEALPPPLRLREFPTGGAADGESIPPGPAKFLSPDADEPPFEQPAGGNETDAGDAYAGETDAGETDAYGGEPGSDEPAADAFDPGDASFANFDWAAGDFTAGPGGRLAGGSSGGGERTISLRPTLSAQDEILAAAIREAGPIAAALAEQNMPRAESLAQQALEQAEAALRKAEAVEAEFRAYVESMRHGLLRAAAEWRAANGRR